MDELEVRTHRFGRFWERAAGLEHRQAEKDSDTYINSDTWT